MRELDAVNLTLEALGESRVMDISTSNPSAGLARSALARNRRGLLSTGYWFNVVEREITPTADGFIKVPWNQLAVYDACSDNKYGVRYGNLYNLVEQDEYFNSPVKIKVVLDLDFEDLPEHAAMWIANYTTAQVYLNDLGSDGNYANYASEAERYKSLVLREHLRNQKYSTSKTRFARRIRRARFMI
ncbi:tail tubular protein A [Klebsiella phage vB_KpnP_SU503]|uniref:Tail tubular protein A n=1 Tax=Klebsiella phage vB_KpnP_SU503 TaxID=1610834 RepID=A0A0C5PQY1_9CAUD|nr:tail protein [Klebsiella phage vB_KpnP_SU503]AJQ21051.1 tail tubular protein A [Klebsiella phage vB_KpnP_SU503]